MSPAKPNSRVFTLHLPHRALWIALAAFIAGLALFAVVYFSGRKDQALYSVKPADKSGEAAAMEPLPEPMTAQDSASGMQSASADAQAAAARSGESGGASPQPMPEDDSQGRADGPPAGTSAPANTAQQADRVTPLPMNGQSPPPAYPPAALRRGETGTVTVRIQVDAQGNPGGVALIQRSGSRELDRAAMQAVRKWHFQAAIKDGRPVPGTVDIPVEFNLQR